MTIPVETTTWLFNQNWWPTSALLNHTLTLPKQTCSMPHSFQASVYLFSKPPPPNYSILTHESMTYLFCSKPPVVKMIADCLCGGHHRWKLSRFLQVKRSIWNDLHNNGNRGNISNFQKTWRHSSKTVDIDSKEWTPFVNKTIKKTESIPKQNHISASDRSGLPLVQGSISWGGKHRQVLRQRMDNRLRPTRSRFARNQSSRPYGLLSASQVTEFYFRWNIKHHALQAITKHFLQMMILMHFSN